MRYLLVLLLLAACAQPIKVVAPDDEEKGVKPSTPKNRTVYERK